MSNDRKAISHYMHITSDGVRIDALEPEHNVRMW